MAGETALFYLFAVMSVAASVLVIGQRNPIYSVLLLIVSFVALAGLYVLLDAPFLAVIQIIIYAGAILVLFLFVVMLLNVPYEQLAPRTRPGVRLRRYGALLGAVLMVQLVWALWRTGPARLVSPFADRGAAGEDISSVALIGRVLFTDYALAFEVTSILIIVAMVGAVVLAKREIR